MACIMFRMARLSFSIREYFNLLQTGGVTSSIPLNPKVFHISTLRKLDTAIRQANQEIEESTVDDCDYGGLSQDDIKRFQQVCLCHTQVYRDINIK